MNKTIWTLHRTLAAPAAGKVNVTRTALPRGLIMLCIGIGFFFTNSVTQAAEASETPLELFKSFIANPPIIERIVYEKLPTIDVPDATAVAVKQIYLLRWQPNAFFLCELSSDKDLSQSQPSAMLRGTGQYDNFFWSYSDDQGLKTYMRTPDSLPGERTNGVFQTYVANMEDSSWVLNLGIPNQDIGSIQWIGNTFSPRTNHYGIVWEGTLVADENNYPKELLLTNTVLATEKTFFHRVVYSFSPNSQIPFIPTKIKIMRKLGANSPEELSERFLIHILQTNSRPLPKESFMYGGYKLANTNVTIYSNNMLMAMVNGKLKTIVTQTTAPQHKNPIYWVIIGLMFAPIAILLWRGAVKKK